MHSWFYPKNWTDTSQKSDSTDLFELLQQLSDNQHSITESKKNI